MPAKIAIRKCLKKRENNNMKRTRLSALMLALVAGTAFAAPDRPNVLIVLSDDHGYGDIGAHGHPFLKTPNMDKLYAESVRFTDFHVAPMCSPTRGQLMT